MRVGVKGNRGKKMITGVTCRIKCTKRDPECGGTSWESTIAKKTANGKLLKKHMNSFKAI